MARYALAGEGVDDAWCAAPRALRVILPGLPAY